MAKEIDEEKLIDRQMERYSHLTLMAIEAKERDLQGGIMSNIEFAVVTSETAASMFRWSNQLKLHFEFVVSYKEEDRVKYSVLKKVDNDYVELIEPAIRTVSTLPRDQFMEEWGLTNNWLMMFQK